MVFTDNTSDFEKSYYEAMRKIESTRCKYKSWEQKTSINIDFSVRNLNILTSIYNCDYSFLLADEIYPHNEMYDYELSHGYNPPQVPSILRTINNWLQKTSINEDYRVNLRDLKALCNVLHCDYEYLLGNCESFTIPPQKTTQIIGLSEEALNALKTYKEVDDIAFSGLPKSCVSYRLSIFDSLITSDNLLLYLTAYLTDIDLNAFSDELPSDNPILIEYNQSKNRLDIMGETSFFKKSDLREYFLLAILDELYNQLAVERKDGKDGGYAPKTIKHVHNLISSIFSMAIKWNIVTDNPCDRVVPPKQIPACDKVKYFTVEQTEIFIGLLDQRYTSTYRSHDRIDDTGIAYHVDEYTETRTVPTQFKLFYLLAIYCGMRRGEILALEWSDLDFSNNSISITKSTTIANGKPITKTPKTKASIRKISVPAFLMELARNYRREQLQYRLSLGSEWVGENYVFIQANGKQMHPDTPYNKFKSIIRCYNAHIIKEEEKLPEISLHGLRHTSATLMISQNVDIRTVSNRLGHAQTSTTLDIYSHALQKMDEQASSALDTLLNHKISS